MEIIKTESFNSWFSSLRDKEAKSRISSRLRNVSLGNLGNYKRLGEINELKIDCGPGYRIYFLKRGDLIVVLLSGGDKSTQDKDIKAAKIIAEDWVKRYG